MGIAIIIPDVSFADTNLGKVTLSELVVDYYDWLLVDQLSFIDTEYVPNESTKIEMQFALTQTKAFNHIFGRRTGTSSASDTFSFDMRKSNPGSVFSYNGDGSNISEMCVISKMADLFIHSISLRKNEAFIDAEELTFDRTLGNSETTLYLGGTNDGEGLVNTQNQPMIGKIYETKIYENNVLIHDYIPAAIKSNDIIGMFDSVTNEFKQVQGNGEASVGNDN